MVYTDGVLTTVCKKVVFLSLLCPAPRVGALSNYACLTSVCRVHRASVENREA